MRAGRRDEALSAARRARRRGGRKTGSRWARAAAAARCRGAARARRASSARAFEAALALHDGLPMPFERARTLLRLGERLRRAKQRAEAREPLTAALDAFERLGARPWAERARTELRATGGQAGAPRAQTAAEQLTPHELQIAVLVSQGMTNREAAAALFLSPEDDRVPPRPDLPQARRARPRAARAADGDGAAGRRARPGRARRGARLGHQHHDVEQARCDEQHHRDRRADPEAATCRKRDQAAARAGR